MMMGAMVTGAIAIMVTVMGIIITGISFTGTAIFTDICITMVTGIGIYITRIPAIDTEITGNHLTRVLR
jgi:type IV secretory pathway VirB2 component (pilin)